MHITVLGSEYLFCGKPYMVIFFKWRRMIQLKTHGDELEARMMKMKVKWLKMKIKRSKRF